MREYSNENIWLIHVIIIYFKAVNNHFHDHFSHSATYLGDTFNGNALRFA